MTKISQQFKVAGGGAGRGGNGAAKSIEENLTEFYVFSNNINEPTAVTHSLQRAFYRESMR